MKKVLLEQIETFIHDMEERYGKPRKEAESDAAHTDNMAHSERSIAAFQQIMRESKEGLEDSDEAHMKEVLSTLYGLDTDSCMDKGFCRFVSDFTDTYIDDNTKESSEMLLKTYRRDIEQVEAFSELLMKRFTQLERKSSVTRIWRRRERFYYASLLRQLNDISVHLKKNLDEKNGFLSELIIKNFYNIYIFFSFIIELLRNRRNELKLIAVCNQLDRFLTILDGSVKQTFKSELPYHYALYELKELRRNAFADFFVESEM